MIPLLLSLGAAGIVNSQEDVAFLSWMRSTNQLFTGDDYHLRLGIFLTNSRVVEEHNAHYSYQLALNKFAALTSAEYRAILGLHDISCSINAYPTQSAMRAPESLDWRQLGAVNDIRDQGNCASSWAFAAIVAAEGSYFVSSQGSKTLLSLSESNLMDCVSGCYGCYGGLVDLAFQYVLTYQDGRFQSRLAYPYAPVKANCRFDSTKAAGDLKDFVAVVQGNEDDLALKCTKYGPIACLIDGSPASFQLYHSGIYSDKACHRETVQQGVGCVGFGKEDQTRYWILRNSWGSGWGESGYIRLIRGVNMCGVASLGYAAVTHMPPR
jgi:cathepsin L